MSGVVVEIVEVVGVLAVVMDPVVIEGVVEVSVLVVGVGIEVWAGMCVFGIFCGV